MPCNDRALGGVRLLPFSVKVEQSDRPVAAEGADCFCRKESHQADELLNRLVLPEHRRVDLPGVILVVAVIEKSQPTKVSIDDRGRHLGEVDRSAERTSA